MYYTAAKFMGGINILLAFLRHIGPMGNTIGIRIRIHIGVRIGKVMYTCFRFALRIR